ncbi:MAG: VOC family protein [Acinetobacter sp.]
MMANALVPELTVSDWQHSKQFYCDILGFHCEYERVEEGFCYLKLGDAELMIDQLGVGRTFEDGHQPVQYPFGRGLNIQIQVADLNVILSSLIKNDIPFFLPVEERWYRVNDCESGNRQLVVADPDGYLLRFFQDLGVRSVPHA